MSQSKIILPGQSEQSQPEPQQLPEGVVRIDFFVVERIINADGSMNLSFKVNGTDERVVATINSFEIVGVLEAAKNIVLNSGLAKR